MHAHSNSPAEAVLDAPASAATPFNPARVLQGLGKHLKPLVAGSVLFAAAAALLTDAHSITSNDAVISSGVVTVRAPLGGTFTLAGPHSSSPVARGAALGTITDTRVDTLAAQNYLSQVDEAHTEIAALDAERSELLTQRTTLARRAAAHQAALGARMTHEVAESERLATVRQASLELTTSDLQRTGALYRDGIVSRAAYEKSLSANAVAQGESAAQQADLAATRIEASAVREGLMIETGSNNDVAYSVQRIDEINLRLADLARERAELAATAAAAQANYAPAIAHARLLSHADLLSPATGDLWKWFAADGERVGAGDRLAEIVNCHSGFLLASYGQDRVPAITIGAHARYRLAGETAEHSARVVSLEAEQPPADAPPLAARPTRSSDGPAVVVRLALDPADRPSGCAVGRTATVAIDTHSSDLLVTAFEHYF